MHARYPIALISFVKRACASAVFVLLAVLAHDGPGGAWPKVARLVKLSGCSESAVHRALRLLVRFGVLVSCRRHRPNGADTTTAYWLAPKWAAQLGCQGWKGEGATDGTPLEIPEHTQLPTPISPTACLPAAGAEVATVAGGDAPPAPPAASSGPCALGPAERTAACLALLALNGESYPAAHGGRVYLPQRTDERGARRLVVFAIASGCRTLAAVVAWCRAYLSRFWTLGGKAAERGHVLADARKASEFCRPRPRPTVVPRSETVAPADPAAYGRTVEDLASKGIEFAIMLSRSRARAAAG
jgi:hypothetical protein